MPLAHLALDGGAGAQQLGYVMSGKLSGNFGLVSICVWLRAGPLGKQLGDRSR